MSIQKIYAIHSFENHSAAFLGDRSSFCCIFDAYASTLPSRLLALLFKCFHDLSLSGLTNFLGLLLFIDETRFKLRSVSGNITMRKHRGRVIMTQQVIMIAGFCPQGKDCVTF